MPQDVASLMKSGGGGAGEIVQWLRTFATIGEYLSLVHNSHTRSS